jgi:hypothetical protein
VLWTCVIATVGVLPWYQHGLGQVAISGFYMHNAVGMWFTPLALRQTLLRLGARGVHAAQQVAVIHVAATGTVPSSIAP